jgi:hypothetical protein
MPQEKKSVADRLREAERMNQGLQLAYAQLATQHDWLTAVIGVYLGTIESKKITLPFMDVKNFDVKLNVVQFTKPQGEDVLHLSLVPPGVCIKHARMYPGPDKCPICVQEAEANGNRVQ